MTLAIGQSVIVTNPMETVFPFAQVAATKFNLTKFQPGGGFQYAFQDEVIGTVVALPTEFDNPRGGTVTAMAIAVDEQEIIVEASAVSAVTIN